MDNLEKKLALCLVMALLIVAFIPFYWVREPARQEAAIARIQKQSLEKGGKIYLSACGGCHGQQAQGGVGPALGGRDAILVQRIVRSGKGIMPAFSANQISDGEIEDITLFLGSLPKSPAVSHQPALVAAPAPIASFPTPTLPAPTATGAPGTPKGGDLVSQGEGLYLRKAGGVGCAGCHGTDASGAIGPNIRGSPAQDIMDALGTAASMNFLRLTNDEVEAIAAYLKYIESQR